METLIPLLIGIVLAFLIARWAYKKESKKSRKLVGSILGAVIGLFLPLIVASFIFAPDAEPKTHDEIVMAKLSNSLDGCQQDMKQGVKKSMNDPDSFKCIETNIIKRKDDYVLIMQFTGKNQLGGTEKHVAKAEYNSDGKFVKFIE